MEVNKLKRDNLNMIETIAVAAAIMAPSASMSLNVALITSASGFSVSLIFIITLIVTGFISVSIIKFNRHLSSAGSLYTFTEKALGKKLGFVSGWTLFLTYFMLSLGCSIAFGFYISNSLNILGINISWQVVSITFSILTWFLTYRDIKLSSRIMFILEAVSILLILILSFKIFIQAGIHHALTLAPFTTNGSSISTIAKGSVFGFLCFAGFEGTSSLGEETRNPKKAIPLVIGGTVICIGIFFLFSSYTQVIGFGLNDAGLKAFATSAAPLSDLATKYISKQFAFVLTLGVALSLFSCTIGTACAGARILFSISRDGNINKNFSKIHHKFNTPYISVSLIMIASIALQVIFFRSNGIDIFNYSFSIASLSILIAYMITSVAAIVYFTKNKLWKSIHLIIPIVSIAALVFTFYSNIYPIPEYPSNIFPYIVIAWIVLGLVISNKRQSITLNNENEETII